MFNILLSCLIVLVIFYSASFILGYLIGYIAPIEQYV